MGIEAIPQRRFEAPPTRPAHPQAILWDFLPRPVSRNAASHFDSDVCFQVQHSPAASIFMTAVLAGENISWAHISWGERRTGMAVANQDETARRAGKLDGQEVTSTTLYIDDSLQPSNGGRRIGATKDYTAVARFAAATTAATGPVRDGDARRRCEGAR